ncbi:MAG: hypothetical protein U9P49_06550 [Thermodesulfobacteriota bacterium]|nr:hypothetical protein [Thermodesulfobacteriota bacterium]
MSDEIYRKLVTVLDTLPNGFPATDSGVEIKLLKKIFTPEEAKLFCDLKMTYETPTDIAQRTGREFEALEQMLITMWKKGQLFGIDFGEVKVFKIMPWIFGIYEFQLNRMDKKLAELCEEYYHTYGKQFF